MRPYDFRMSLVVSHCAAPELKSEALLITLLDDGPCYVSEQGTETVFTTCDIALFERTDGQGSPT